MALPVIPQKLHQKEQAFRLLSETMRTMKGKNFLWIQGVLFWFILAGIFFFLGFWEVFFSGPQGLHFMRQTDSLSFAAQYFNHGFHFFEPRLFNLKNLEGNAACEFPITYYLTALMYPIFGKNYLTLKLLHFIIVGTGVFFIFRLCCLVLKDYIYASLICLFLFTSTVFNYYAFNYLPDAPALGFIFTGWFFFFRYMNDRNQVSLIACFFFFTLGSLIKVTYLINPLSVLIFALFTIILKKDTIMHRTHAKKMLLWGAAGLSVVLCWNIFMICYNDLFSSRSFNTKPLPIWDLSKGQIAEVWDYMRNYWHTKYFAHSSFHFLFIILIFQIVFFKKSDKKLACLILTLLSGSLSYLILFYPQFKDHDYYFLAFFPLVVLIILNGISLLQKFSTNKYLHAGIKILISVIVVAGINYSRMKLHNRFEQPVDDFSKMGLLVEANLEEIKKLNFPGHSTFIIAPDLSQNGGLFFLDRMGWNIERTEDVTVGKINQLRESGADYIVLLSDDAALLPLDKISAELAFRGNGIEIHKLAMPSGYAE